MKPITYIFIFIFIFIATTISAAEKEWITRFHADIQVDTTGRIEITEHISVYAGGIDIKRGIVRSIPIYRKNVSGIKKEMSFNILSVERDGISENYKVEKAGGYWDVYLGSSEVILKPGIYNYIIKYETYGHIGFFDTYDEIYWNVTGNDWQFRIEKASATVILPDGIIPLTNACYTGYAGSTDSNCTAKVQADNKVLFESNKALSYNEGLTIAVSFPRDIISRPPPPSALGILWMKYKYIICSLCSLFIMGIYYFFTWKKVGKDPEKPVVIPQFNPPNGWSPSIVRYIYKKGLDNKVFTTALVSMAVKKSIKISQEGKEYSLEKINSDIPLSTEEATLSNSLFAVSNSIKVNDTNHSRFSAAYTSLHEAIKTKKNLKDYHLKNTKYVVFAVLIILALFIGNIYLLGFNIQLIEALLYTPFIFAGIVIIIASFNERRFRKILLFFFGVIFFFPVFWRFIERMYEQNSILTVCVGLTVLGLAIYIYLIKAPTELGAKTMSELEGFRMYLKTAEENRLNLLTPPERTPELFEQLLPYAIALDVENDWGKKFSEVLERANYQPEWYDSNKPFRPQYFVSSFPNSFTSSVGQARIDPSSSSGSSGSGSWSSGSGGGGFSGGGGGGGGGRGW